MWAAGPLARAAGVGLSVAGFRRRPGPDLACPPPVPQSLSLEDQVEGGESELRRLKAEESSLRRLAGARRDRLATAQFRVSKKHEDAEQHKRVVIE